MQRIVQPEILDSLDPTDPVALANRRDIRLLNRLLGNFRWIAKALRQSGCAERIVELGAGDGSLGMYLAEKQRLCFHGGYCGLDLLARPAGWPAEWDWIQGDLRDFQPDEGVRVLLANHILHQFNDSDLEILGLRLRQSHIRWIIINEPLRKRLPLYLAAACRLLGMHPVTLHDARVSILAGFRGWEVAGLMGIHPGEWKIRFQESLLGANRVICERV